MQPWIQATARTTTWRRPAELAPPVEGPQGEQIVDAERAVEGDGARQAAPDEDEPVLPRRHGLERDEPERVVEEVGREVGEEHEARSEEHTSELQSLAYLV